MRELNGGNTNNTLSLLSKASEGVPFGSEFTRILGTVFERARHRPSKRKQKMYIKRSNLRRGVPSGARSKGCAHFIIPAVHGRVFGCVSLRLAPVLPPFIIPGELLMEDCETPRGAKVGGGLGLHHRLQASPGHYLALTGESVIEKSQA